MIITPYQFFLLKLYIFLIPILVNRPDSFFFIKLSINNHNDIQFSAATNYQEGLQPNIENVVV